MSGQGRIVVAMSGGVDSSVAAALLAAEGREVIGVTLQLQEEAAPVPGSRSCCCAGVDRHDARRVCERLGIAHYVFDFSERFRDAVVDDFADSYLAGETPVPCIRCNERIKFADLLAYARELGAEALATGHYVRRVDGPGGPELHRPADDGRDQSWFLFATTSDQLRQLRFPLGEMKKSEVRARAAELGLAVADKPDSQDICFVPGGRYAELIERLRPGAGEPGEIVDEEGRVLGRHQGVFRYTVGQRRGLGLDEAAGALYVLRLEPEARRVVVGPRERLARQRVALREVNWLGQAGPVEGRRISVRLRSSMKEAPARLTLRPEGVRDGAPDGAPDGARAQGGGLAGELVLDEPVFGVAPGQAAAFYEGSRILGGGWIVRPAAPA